jgi:catechol 2,3-dioxygenase-like lactoylglutathione lyase family enzyme
MAHLGLVTVVVRDYDEAIDFYVRAAGFHLVEDTRLDEHKRWVVVSPPGGRETSVLLARAANAVQRERIGSQAGGRVWAFLRTDDFERDYQRMRAAGVRFTEGPRQEPYGTVAVFEDLYGNRWDLIQPGSAATDQRPDAAAGAAGAGRAGAAGAAARTLIWRGLDAPRMEITYVQGTGRAHGTQIGLVYELRWQLDGPVLDLEVTGGRRARITLGDTDFFDVLDSPFFNSLPVIRDGLLEHGQRRDYLMSFVQVPQLTVTAVPQAYEPLGNGVIRYRAASFQADISYDSDGYVTYYPGFLERVAALA